MASPPTPPLSRRGLRRSLGLAMGEARLSSGDIARSRLRRCPWLLVARVRSRPAAARALACVSCSACEGMPWHAHPDRPRWCGRPRRGPFLWHEGPCHGCPWWRPGRRRWCGLRLLGPSRRQGSDRSNPSRSSRVHGVVVVSGRRGVGRPLSNGDTACKDVDDHHGDVVMTTVRIGAVHENPRRCLRPPIHRQHRPD